MKLTDFYADGGPLGAVLGTGYSRRVQQVRMSEVAMDTIQREGAAASLLDAKTGTGKSLGYIIPHALARQKLVISTATKNLQHQLLAKELPTVAEAMKLVGLEPPSFALLKGRSNYLCQSRHDAEVVRKLREAKDPLSAIQPFRPDDPSQALVDPIVLIQDASESA